VLNIFDIFRCNRNNTFFPVINSHKEPLGIIRERHLKKYTYSLYGKDLLRNPSAHKKLKDFITWIPIAEINTPAEKILEMFSLNEDIEGILIVDNMHYAGFLSAQSLLRILNKKNLAVARDQNPLTKLPGNSQIYEYLSRSLTQQRTHHTFIYFDLDNFKPFNDKYGFRQGDRILLLFAELLKKKNNAAGQFIAHIGGDDFFMGYRSVPLTEVKKAVLELINTFKHEVESFYHPEDLQNGYIISKDREGNRKEFPLLTVSAVILEVPASHNGISTENISMLLAQSKKAAKRSEDKIYIANMT
jgi:diguanylate cyclase (GGDEF)-like protein